MNSANSPEIEEILMNAEEIDEATTRIAKEIDRDISAIGGKVILVGILKGSVVFMSDLMKKLATPVEIDFMKVSSYKGTESTGRIEIKLDLNRSDISNATIIIVEDIIDSGRTLAYLTEYLRLNGAKNVKTCTLLDKPSRRVVEFVPDYIGKEIEDKFVIGYGLDYDERYRTLPFVGVLSKSVYAPDEGKE
ncbi:MAG: hypoxanthine phosphoribosyltransferase [Clostridia bacterium]|nr:hypoxanthine phosphoribosyltransferase [Clostridia bacterium]